MLKVAALTLISHFFLYFILLDRCTLNTDAKIAANGVKFLNNAHRKENQTAISVWFATVSADYLDWALVGVP